MYQAYLAEDAAPVPGGADAKLMLWIIFGAFATFIVVPVLKNFYDLIKFQGDWQRPLPPTGTARCWTAMPTCSSSCPSCAAAPSPPWSW